jgi:hypothetical protein
LLDTLLDFAEMNLIEFAARDEPATAYAVLVILAAPMICWAFYILRSRRVRATFVRGWPGATPPPPSLPVSSALTGRDIDVTTST